MNNAPICNTLLYFLCSQESAFTQAPVSKLTKHVAAPTSWADHSQLFVATQINCTEMSYDSIILYKHKFRPGTCTKSQQRTRGEIHLRGKATSPSESSSSRGYQCRASGHMSQIHQRGTCLCTHTHTLRRSASQ